MSRISVRGDLPRFQPLLDPTDLQREDDEMFVSVLVGSCTGYGRGSFPTGGVLPRGRMNGRDKVTVLHPASFAVNGKRCGAMRLNHVVMRNQSALTPPDRRAEVQRQECFPRDTRPQKVAT